jgi:hypothetical protein
MPARRKRAGRALSAAKGAAAKLVDLCLDMEDPLNEALDAAHALRLIGHALREVGNERDARAVAATAWFACQRLEALQQKWNALFKATARAASLRRRWISS